MGSNTSLTLTRVEFTRFCKYLQKYYLKHFFWTSPDAEPMSNDLVHVLEVHVYSLYVYILLSLCQYLSNFYLKCSFEVSAAETEFVWSEGEPMDVSPCISGPNVIKLFLFVNYGFS